MLALESCSRLVEGALSFRVIKQKPQVVVRHFRDSVAVSRLGQRLQANMGKCQPSRLQTPHIPEDRFPRLSPDCCWYTATPQPGKALPSAKKNLACRTQCIFRAYLGPNLGCSLCNLPTEVPKPVPSSEHYTLVPSLDCFWFHLLCPGSRLTLRPAAVVLPTCRLAGQEPSTKRCQASQGASKSNRPGYGSGSF